mgnify:CR=1 FL=1
MYKKIFKPLFDFTVSLILVLIISPVILVLTFLLFMANRGKPFFFQDRPGKNEKKITIIKFKSMNDRCDKNGNLLPDAERLTKVGGLVRKYSLDELPQLFSVLKGDMSLVGPRPLLFKYLPLYNDTQRRRHDVKPGITGWAQINGRNSLSWPKKFQHDVYYVENMSFAFDIKILWRTFYKVIKSEGINQSAGRPMKPFTGED